jgi:hypothetical protein
MKTVKFIKSPVGKFGLAYKVGDEAELTNEQCEELINAEFAVLVETEEEEKEIVIASKKKK